MAEAAGMAESDELGDPTLPVELYADALEPLATVGDEDSSSSGSEGEDESGDGTTLFEDIPTDLTHRFCLLQNRLQAAIRAM
jgi:hypothetical protein